MQRITTMKAKAKADAMRRFMAARLGGAVSDGPCFASQRAQTIRSG